jgi:hypothetical protein
MIFLKEICFAVFVEADFLQEYKSKRSYTPEDGHVGRNM